MRPFILASEVQGSLHCKVAFVLASEAGTVQFCVVSPLAWELQGILLRKAVTVAWYNFVSLRPGFHVTRQSPLQSYLRPGLRTESCHSGMVQLYVPSPWLPRHKAISPAKLPSSWLENWKEISTAKLSQWHDKTLSSFVLAFRPQCNLPYKAVKD